MHHRSFIWTLGLGLAALALSGAAPSTADAAQQDRHATLTITGDRDAVGPAPLDGCIDIWTGWAPHEGGGQEGGQSRSGAAGDDGQHSGQQEGGGQRGGHSKSGSASEGGGQKAGQSEGGGQAGGH